MGYKAIIGVGQADLDTVSPADNGGNSFTAYGPVGGPIVTNGWNTVSPPPTITQAEGLLNNHSAYTSSNMGLLMTSTSNTLNNNINHNLVINGVKGNQHLAILSYTNNGSNIYANGTKITDSTHSDAVPGAPPGSGSPVTVQFAQGWGTGVETGGTGQAVYSGVFWTADQPGGVSVPLSCVINATNSSTGAPKTGGIASRSAHFNGVTGSIATANITSVALAQISMPTGGTWSGLQINIINPPSNAQPVAAICQSCNSASFTTGSSPTLGNQIISVPGTPGAGVIDDVTATDAVPFGNFINYSIVSTGTNVVSIFYSAIGSTWTSAALNVTPLTSADSPYNSSATEAGQVSGLGYTMPRLGGSASIGPGDQEQPCQIPIGGTFSTLNVFMYAATSLSPQPTFNSVIGGFLGNQVGTIPTSQALVADTTHSDAVTAGIYFTNGFLNMTSASFQLGSQAVAFASPYSSGGLSMRGVG